MQDTELGGQADRRGRQGRRLLPSANRDEEVFDGPVRRSTSAATPTRTSASAAAARTSAWAATSPRLELRVLFETLTGADARHRLTGEARRLRSNFINGIKDMPVRIIPAS